MMTTHDKDLEVLIERINLLQEPYRENTLSWLRQCTDRPLLDLRTDLDGFLRELNPIIREYFILQTRMILKNAVHHFGMQSENRAMLGMDSVGSY
jgi:hypothetical protein